VTYLVLIVVTVCTQLTRDLFAMTEFLVLPQPASATFIASMALTTKAREIA